MGYDSACTLHFDGRSTRGTAVLEHKELIFRGPFRLAIPLKEITIACADGGSLDVNFGGRRARFDLGPSAAKWAERISNPPSRLDKLGVKPAMLVLAVSVVDPAFLAELAQRGARVIRRPSKDRADLVFFGAERREALDRMASLSRSIKPNGALWVIRPKGRQTVTEADVMLAGRQAGLVDVKVVSFSDSHTAEKFVIPRVKRPNS